MATDSSESRFAEWIAALDERHLADLTLPEVGRALRALSSCYVERRSRLAAGAALDGAGKRAAFALFYAPLHFQVTLHVVGRLAGAADVDAIVDLGCGTGAAGAAWAAATAARARVTGVDRNPWAVAEANWTYARLGIRGRASRQDLTRTALQPRDRSGVLAAYAVNEIDDEARSVLLPRLIDAGRRGAAVLIVEPIARRLAPWWPSWQAAFAEAGGRGDEWRFQPELPPRQRQLAKSAGLDPRELTARTLFLSGR